MNSDEIFSYSEDFLNEIIDDLVLMKNKKISNLLNNDLDIKLKTLMGKSLNEDEFKEIILLQEKDFRKKITQKFDENRKNRIKILGEKESKEIEKRILLQSIDLNWKSHIQYLEQLRQVIGLRSYGQRDPLNEYKKEAFNLFSNLLEKLKLDYITILMNLRVIEQPKEEINSKKNVNNLNSPKCLLVVKNKQKISRNERCEATGKKFKNCCGAL